ncbi:MAG: toprim domain-containing protein [Pseudomonadota bacterium]
MKAAVGLDSSHEDPRPISVLHDEIIAAEKADEEKRRQKQVAAVSMWSESEPLRVSLAEAYLKTHRGISVPDTVYRNDQLRFSANPFMNDWEGSKFPDCAGALVARMVDPLTNEQTGVHRTFLRSDGSKIDRRMLGQAGIVKLTDAEAQGEAMTGLGIGEGLESSLAAMVRYKWQPIWSCLTAGGISSFPMLPHVEALTIFGDHDREKNGRKAGQDAANECKARWLAAGCEVSIATPPDIGTDFADLLETGEAA